MILGSFPCCNGTLALAMGDRSGYAPHTCPHCGANVWTRFSRVNPESWTDTDFRREFIVDDEKRTVVPRGVQAVRGESKPPAGADGGAA